MQMSACVKCQFAVIICCYSKNSEINTISQFSHSSHIAEWSQKTLIECFHKGHKTFPDYIKNTLLNQMIICEIYSVLFYM